jgi:undecaprenyl-diphosphatase
VGWLEALLLGLVQGLTEFLPVSSSGHLVIVETLLGRVRGEEGILFEVAVHVGTLVAILAFYWRKITSLLVGLAERDAASWRYAAKLIVATLPAAAVGLGARSGIERLFELRWVAGVALLVTSAILLTTRHTVPRADRPEPSFGQAFWIGCAQAVAIVPGISRSGTTVAVALGLRVAPLAAAEFSFMMAIIAIAGAGLLLLPDVPEATPEMLRACALGAVVAALAGLAALALFVRLLRSRRFHHFAYYTFAAGGSFLLCLALRGPA